MCPTATKRWGERSGCLTYAILRYARSPLPWRAQSEVLRKLNSLIPSLAVDGMRGLVKAIRLGDDTALLEMLAFSCEIASRLLMALSDADLFERGEPVAPAMLLEMSTFLNELVTVALWQRETAADPWSAGGRHSPERLLFRAASKLLGMIFDTDTRRSFAPDGHWLATCFSLKEFRSEFEAERRSRGQGGQAATARYERAHTVLQRPVSCHVPPPTRG